MSISRWVTDIVNRCIGLRPQRSSASETAPAAIPHRQILLLRNRIVPASYQVMVQDADDNEEEARRSTSQAAYPSTSSTTERRDGESGNVERRWRFHQTLERQQFLQTIQEDRSPRRREQRRRKRNSQGGGDNGRGLGRQQPQPESEDTEEKELSRQADEEIEHCMSNRPTVPYTPLKNCVD